MNYIASPLNYIGGKYKLLPQILPLFPNKINTFVDLFCGGCNVGINVCANKIIFNDNLIFLIDLYKEFQKNTIEEIINYIENRIKEFELDNVNEEGFLKLRKEYNTNRKPLDLFVLISFSFNHQIRFNNNHQFNTSFAKEHYFNSNMKKNLIDFIKVLHKRDITFVSNNFVDFDFSILNEGDFVYADPPYLISVGTYNDGKRGFTGWNEEYEKDLLKILKELSERNIYFGLSNVISHKGQENTILKNWIEENNFNINYLDKNYSNCNYQLKDRSKNSTKEVFVTNYVSEFKEIKLF